MLGILRQKVGAGSSSAVILGQRIHPATSAVRGFASVGQHLLHFDLSFGKPSEISSGNYNQMMNLQFTWPVDSQEGLQCTEKLQDIIGRWLARIGRVAGNKELYLGTSSE
ncbi:hypothetical protein EV2_003745 [Malus domestica]